MYASFLTRGLLTSNSCASCACTAKIATSLNDALDRLSEKGLLAELRSGHFVAVGENTEYMAGRLSIHRDGFGFLIPDARKERYLPSSGRSRRKE